jgi:small subunit ribosomal protein S19e
MTTIYDTETSDLIEKTAEELKKSENLKAPEWASYVKTGVHKERPPIKNDWWYMRAASVLRKIYVLGPIGVSKLRVKYGGKKNRGYKTEHFFRGSGNILRKILQQLEKEEFVKTELKTKHRGRIITAKGKKFLNDIAGKIVKVKPKVADNITTEKNNPIKPKSEIKKQGPVGNKDINPSKNPSSDKKNG